MSSDIKQLQECDALNRRTASHLLICYNPGFDFGKGLIPNLWFRLVSSAPAAAETNVLDVKGGQNAPQDPKSTSNQSLFARLLSNCWPFSQNQTLREPTRHAGVDLTFKKLSTYCSRYRPQSLLLSWSGTLQYELCICSALKSLDEPRRTSHSDSK